MNFRILTLPAHRAAGHAAAALAAAGAVLLAACGGVDDSTDGGVQVAQLPPAVTTTTALASCTDLATRITYANTSIASAVDVAAGTLTVASSPVGAHCLVKGSMFQRTSTVDNASYAIAFEMRLPRAWNGRFYYQANGGIDGSVVTATGSINGGGGLDNALNMGFAVISSDTGHLGSQGPFFGLDPQARLDYGYQAAAKLTPMAKAAIGLAYGRAPDRSYFGGCSNGGRHTMVAAHRMADQYDGYLVGDPGFNLPKAAIANIAGAQIYNSLASTAGDISTGWTAPERTLVSNAVLAKCDALDGATDGLIQDTNACQAAFNLARDVPTCTGARDGTCLTAAQKTGIAKLFSGPTTSTGTKIYATFPYDTGLYTGGYAFWEYTAPVALDSGAVAAIWGVPPQGPVGFNGPNFALTGNVDTMLASVSATNATYAESALSFMTPPNPTDLAFFKRRGAKMMIYHGTADPIFSSDDTTAYYEGLRAANGGDASNFARFYRIPGMNHCSGGPATDQFDMLTPLVKWVEQGVAPDSVVASARGTGNPGGVNADVPAAWSSVRSRPLCPYPQVARYRGVGSVELAASFECRV
jgi:hypothetical protein